MILVNFKTTKEGTGENAVKLAKICEKIQKETKIEIVPVVQAADCYRVSKAVHTKIFVQHIDPVEYGANTGNILPEAVKQNGAVGTLINHAEKQIDLNVIKKTIERAKELNLITVVCIAKPSLAKKVAQMSPDYLAIEPPELIGGNISVATAKPELIVQCVENADGTPVLCGAGIKTIEDVKKALEYGARGILIASGITKADNPEAKLRELAKGFQ
ncbi:triosephosphate isomerase [Candidatus Woesearchaeota archaeon]|nr:triosephosphate isomerase [Candidatus Woesearchaeota archaeon]